MQIIFSGLDWRGGGGGQAGGPRCCCDRGGGGGGGGGNPAAQGTKPIPAEQLASFFTFDMFGLFLEVFIVWQLKLKIDIWRDSGQLLGCSTAHWPGLIRRPVVEKLLV